MIAKLGTAALLGAAVAYVVMKRAPRLRLRIPTREQLRHGFGGYAGAFASPGLDSAP